MSYSAPPTFTDGVDLPASQLNILGDDIAYLKGASDGVSFSGVKLKREGTAQSIPNNADTDVVMLTELFDVGAWWSSGASVVVPASAIPSGFTTVALVVIALLRFAVNGTGGRWVKVYQNGAEADYMSTTADAAELTPVALTTVLQAAAGDEIKVVAKQNSGGALDVGMARLIVVRLAPIS